MLKKLAESIRQLFFRSSDTYKLTSIGVLGASLSAQTVNHKTGELTGYVEALRRSYADALGVVPENIQQFAYGGNRLSDAGLILLDEVIDAKPDICILEPVVEDVSRGREITSADFLYVIRKLTENGILPIVFRVPLPLETNVASSDRYVLSGEICERYAIPLITSDLSKAIEAGMEFNGLHTLKDTAQFLAEELGKYLLSLNLNDAWRSLSAQNRLPVSKIKVVKLDDVGTTQWSTLSFQFSASQESHLVLLQKQNIGPFSPVLQIAVKGSDGQEVAHSLQSVWDRFCYYQRSSFVTLCNVDLPKGGGIITVEIANEYAPNYNSCKKFEGKWPNAQGRKIDPIGVIHCITQSDTSIRTL